MSPEWPGWSPCLCRLLRVRSQLSCEMTVDGVADALVGGVRLAVDAVGVDLQQDSDTVASAACDFGGRYPGVEPQGDGGVPQVIRPPGQR